MRKSSLLLLLAALVALPAAAESRHQSYFTYDDGGTIVRQGDDGKEVEARVNFPVFPGDEVVTSRAGRAEIRLSDGNVVALDRSTDLIFRSILDSYDGNAARTVAELRYGHVVVERLPDQSEPLRLDTSNASYVSSAEAIYALDTDTRGRDHVTVFDGTLEVRTPAKSVRIASGDSANVDTGGLYDLVNNSGDSADAFERWFLQRAGRYSRASSRYLDRSLAYSDAELDSSGSWVFVGGVGNWCWRPYVNAGWRPYYYGSWTWGPSGMVWVSDEPWGWVPYHYGRWAYDGAYGWVWMPGAGYSPAWVYWMYGPGYVGWAPAGWWDCYRPYYDWCYRPYAHAGAYPGWGYGHVGVHGLDMRPWTFVNAGNLTTRRVHSVVVPADQVRQRLMRDNNGIATVSATPARFTRGQIKDPSSAVNQIVRRGIGSGTGKEGSGASAGDMTSFFRRDPELSPGVRERVVRTRPVDSTRTPSGGSATTAASDGRVVRGGRGEAGTGTPATTPAAGVVSRGSTGGSSGTVDRGTYRRPADTPSTSTPGEASTGRVRGGVVRPSPDVQPKPVERTPVTPRDSTGDSGWRSRSVGRGGDASTVQRNNPDTSTVQRGGGDASTVQRGGSTTRQYDRTPVDSSRVSRDRGEAPADEWRAHRGRVSFGSPRPVEPADATPSTRSYDSPRSIDRTDTPSTRSYDAPRAVDTPRGSDIPRRIIESVSGPRIQPAEPTRSSAPEARPAHESRSSEGHSSSSSGSHTSSSSSTHGSAKGKGQ